MRTRVAAYGLAAGLLVGLGLTDAQAAATRPISPEALGLGAAAAPAAMCGFRCRYGGRYIPGPPEVCYARGLEYCGSSRGGGGGYGFYGDRGGGGYGGGCRTVTIERDDGSVRRIRRCD